MPLLALPACSEGGDEGVYGCPDPLINGKAVCLQVQHSASLDPQLDHIRRIIREVMLVIDANMPTDDLTIIVRDSPENTIPEIGLGGFNPDPNRVIISLNPAFPDFGAVLESELAFQVAHEVHHARRRRATGYGSTLLEALVSEGLADHFAMEVTGKPAPLWSAALEGEELEYWLGRAEAEWDAGSYDHQTWFFGSGEIPRWAGYTIGFHLIELYLSDHPGVSASGLYGKRARAFRP